MQEKSYVRSSGVHHRKHEHAALDAEREASMADEGGSSAALMEIDHSDRLHLQRAALRGERRRRGVKTILIGAAAVGVLFGGFALLRARA